MAEGVFMPVIKCCRAVMNMKVLVNIAIQNNKKILKKKFKKKNGQRKGSNKRAKINLMVVELKSSRVDMKE